GVWVARSNRFDVSFPLLVEVMDGRRAPARGEGGRAPVPAQWTAGRACSQVACALLRGRRGSQRTRPQVGARGGVHGQAQSSQGRPLRSLASRSEKARRDKGLYNDEWSASSSRGDQTNVQAG